MLKYIIRVEEVENHESLHGGVSPKETVTAFGELNNPPWADEAKAVLE